MRKVPQTEKVALLSSPTEKEIIKSQRCATYLVAGTELKVSQVFPLTLRNFSRSLRVDLFFLMIVFNFIFLLESDSPPNIALSSS